MTQTTTSAIAKKYSSAINAITDLGSASKVNIYTAGLGALLATFTLGVKRGVSVCTADNTTDVITLNAHGFSNDTPVIFTTTGALPTGLPSTYVYVRDSNTNNFKVALTPNGDVINFTTNGTGILSVDGEVWNVSQAGVITSNNGSNLFTAVVAGTGTAAIASYTKADGTEIYRTNVGLQPINFTVDSVTDVITAPYHNYPNGERVKFIGAALPAPLAINTEYEVGDVANAGLVNASFKAYINRAVVNLTTAGSAPMTVSNFAGLQLNTGTAAIPSLDISTGQILAISSISITII